MHFNGQPRPGWDCGSIYAGNPNLNWESMSCFREQGFICKIPSGRELDDQIHGHYQGYKPGWIPFKVKFLKIPLDLFGKFELFFHKILL